MSTYIATARMLCISGNIGAGKSTLVAKLVSLESDWQTIPEPHETNPFLEPFYRDMREYSLRSQLFFLGRRLREYRAAMKRGGTHVQDRSLYEDAAVFARNLYQTDMMQEDEYSVYRILSEEILDMVPRPTAIVYLKASPELLLERIKGRGRPYESDISIDYLLSLNELYDEWANSIAFCPVKTLDIEQYDILTSPAHLEAVTQICRDLLGSATLG